MVASLERMVRTLSARRSVGVCGLLMLVAAAPARADIEPIRIEYRADAGCPSAEQFIGEVLKRAGNVRLAAAGEPVRTFVVTIQRDATGYSGSLTIREAVGETYARKVSGRECPAVADALVLSTAIAVDPLASEAPPASAPSTKTSDPTGAPAAAGTPREGSGEAPGGERDRRSSAEKSARGTNLVPESERESERESEFESELEDEPEYEIPITPPIWRHGWSSAIALGPELRLWTTPRPALGGTFRFAVYPPESGRPLGSFGSELTVLQSLDETIGEAAASFRLLLVRPFICALLGRPSQGLELMPCLSAELGAITGEGSGLPEPTTQHRFWFALEPELRLEQTLGERGLLGIGAGAVFAMTRYRYGFDDPDTRIYEIPLVGFAANLRFGWHL